MAGSETFREFRHQATENRGFCIGAAGSGLLWGGCGGGPGLHLAAFVHATLFVFFVVFRKFYFLDIFCLFSRVPALT